MEKIGNIIIESGIPYMETRGRPTSDEYLALIVAKVGKSFTSHKSRDSLYQIARNLGIKVNITSAGEDGWRVFKAGERVIKPRLPKPLKPLISNEVKAYSRKHGREMDSVSDKAARKLAKGASRQGRQTNSRGEIIQGGQQRRQNRTKGPTRGNVERSSQEVTYNLS